MTNEDPKTSQPGRDSDRLMIAVLIAIGLQGLVVVWGQLGISGRIDRISNAIALLSANPATVTSEKPTGSSTTPAITNTSTSEGGSVILGEESARRESLKEQPELKTSEIAFLLGVTNDAITKRIETLADGTLWYNYGGERYPVRTFQNTYKIRNPFLARP